MIQRIFLVVVLGLVLNGCSQDTGPYGGHPYDWYKAHIKEAQAEVQWCHGKSTHPDGIESCNLAQRAVNNHQWNEWLREKPTPGGF